MCINTHIMTGSNVSLYLNIYWRIQGGVLNQQCCGQRTRNKAIGLPFETSQAVITDDSLCGRSASSERLRFRCNFQLTQSFLAWFDTGYPTELRSENMHASYKVSVFQLFHGLIDICTPVMTLMKLHSYICKSTKHNSCSIFIKIKEEATTL